MFSTKNGEMMQVSKIDQNRLPELSPDYVKVGEYYTYIEPNFIALVKVVDKYHSQNAFKVLVESSVGKKIASSIILISTAYNQNSNLPKVYPKELFFSKLVSWILSSRQILVDLSNQIIIEVPSIRKKINDDFDWAKLIALKLTSLVYENYDEQYEFINSNSDLFKVPLNEEEIFVICQFQLTEIHDNKTSKVDAVNAINFRLSLYMQFDLLDSGSNWENLRLDVDKLRKSGFMFQQDQRILNKQMDTKQFYINYIFQNSRRRRINLSSELDKNLYNSLCEIENKSCMSIFQNTDMSCFNNFFTVKENMVYYPIIEDYALKLFLFTNLLTDCN